ncbi:hypothetical protein C1X89_24540 [Pseudomonas sp. GP01-A8]|nr:hypothetical protein C0058_10770 [Pseudomonas sp. NC02]PMU23647.1 hypothetical protein C1X90_15915 [Pseudomonas sp. GP01-A9]PMU28755.1 hypothetical protein C1X88_16810 [Pseudomonas sp. GP01-A13]PMU34420.1 hypothetical protein C1X89_24540 [Pseudomonas sp. GP01-A8]PMU49606.1 hypothetical protein C1X87_17040 [Pseudomonas sp. GP01-A14]PMU52642.1 hypothetical protein C1X85_18225 [Pseudomonas sp. GP01-A6]PMU61707.1 hypothetical protein C1X86_16940 [Pseudomonas sp. GP01-A3]PMU72497.1 hypothetica
MVVRSLSARCGASKAGSEQRVHCKKTACSPARFFIVDLEGRASVAASLLLGEGGVQQEKLLLQSNKVCGCLKR